MLGLKPTHILPLVLITINVCAAGVYLSAGDYKRGVYWLFAAGLTYCVTF